MVLSYFIKRVRIVGEMEQVCHWNSKAWSAADAKGYKHKGTAERVQRRLINANKVFPTDVCTIEESAI